MKTLAELRAMFPQYAQVSDGDFLIGLQRKFYPGMHPRQFMDSIDGATNAFTTITRPDFKEYWRTEVQKPMPGETPEQAGARAGGTSYGPANPGGQVGAGARSLLQGLTFGAGDEIVAAGASALGGNSYDYELAKERARLDQGRQDYTGTSLAAELGGALAVPMGAMKSTGKLGMDMLRGAGAGGALSSLYGFFSGEGGAANRVDNATSSGMWGAGIGAAIPVAGLAVQKGMDALQLRKALRDAVKGAPSTEELRQAGSAAYKAVDDLGVTLQPQSVERMGQDAVAMMRQQGMDAGPMSLTPQSARLSEVIGETTSTGAPVPFSELELLRRKAGIPAANMNTPAESNIGSQVIGRIDDYIANLGPDDVAGGDGAALSSAITKAREIWTKRSKSQLIDDAVEASQDYLSGGASGIRNQFKRILSSPKLSRGFTDAEKALMRRAINGSVPQQLLNLMSGGIGQIATTIGGTVLGGVPGGAAGFLTAGATRKLAESLARKEAEQVRAVVASGGMPALPKADPAVRALIERLLRQGTAAGLQQ
jgi:hypothetical protein